MKKDRRGDQGQVGLDELRIESQKRIQRSSARREGQRERCMREEQKKRNGGNEKDDRDGVKGVKVEQESQDRTQ